MRREVIRIYKSIKKPDTYLYLKKQDDFQTVVPEALRELFGQPTTAMDMLLTEDKKLARAEARKVLADIEEKGFYLQLPPPKDDYMLDLYKEKSISDHG